MSTTNTGKPVVAFAHNLGTPIQVQAMMSVYIDAIAASTKISKKEVFATVIRDWLQGPPTARYPAQQIIENVKEANRVYRELYALSKKGKYKVKRPSSTLISSFGLTISESKIGQSISDAIDGFDPEDFYELLEDERAANFDNKLADSVITPQPGTGATATPVDAKTAEAAKAAATGDPVAKEQEVIEQQQQQLETKSVNAKEGIEFIKNLPLPYFTNDDYKTELGIIGNIFVNLRMLYELALDDNLEGQDRKEKKDIALYDYIKSVLTKISDSIGNVNNFDLFCDPASNLMKIIDVNYVDKNSPDSVYKNAFQLEVHNLKSTVRSYSLESKIFPEQSSIVAIGAQVGGGALGTDTTSLVAYNRFIKDRIIPIKDAPTDDLANGTQEKINGMIKNLEVIYQFFSRLKSGLVTDADFDVEEAGGYANALKDLIDFFKQVVSSKTSNKAIIPTTLSVELDGIGGLIIGTIFKIPLDVLPKGYKGADNGGFGSKLGYIMTGLGHTVKDGDWVTKIEAQTIILDPPKAEKEDFDYSSITINTKAVNIQQAVQGGTGGGDLGTGGNVTGTTIATVQEGNGNWNTLNTTLLTINNQGSAAWKELRSNPIILNLYKEVGVPQSSDVTAWCAAFVGYTLKTSGLPYIKGLSSQAYKKYGTEVPLSDPSQWRKWDIVVFSSKSRPGFGHVGFITGVSGDTISVFGGNQGNTVKLSKFNIKSTKDPGPLTAVRRGKWTPPSNSLPAASGEIDLRTQ